MIATWQDPVNQAGHDFGGVQNLHPVGLAALALLALATVVLPRRWNTLPLILLLCFVPAGQRFVIATLDFPFLRLLMMVTWLRLVFRQELRPIVWNRLDRTLLVWAGISIITGTLYAATFNVLVNRAGAAFDSLAVYFFFRHRIRSMDDVAQIAGQFISCSFAVLAFFTVEFLTQRNLFHVMGGVPEFTDIRDGRLRCQGAFAHPILAGCFWACVIPLFAVRGFELRRWTRVATGSAAALGIVVLCASSTPVMAVITGLLGAGCFYFRGALRYVRWLCGIGLVFMHVMMSKPVWHLIARIDVAGGSTGYHRYHLVDKFISNWQEWFLLGTSGTGHWGYGLQDVTNQYVAEGIAGGIVRLALFLFAIVAAFAGISRSMRTPDLPRAHKLAVWALGTAMFMHCANFIAVSYFEQIVALWMMTLGVIGSTTLVPGAEPVRQLESQSLGLARA